jgi:hypothetical protein
MVGFDKEFSKEFPRRTKELGCEAENKIFSRMDRTKVHSEGVFFKAIRHEM